MASVKWSDIYTNFESCEEKKSQILKRILIYKSKGSMVTKRKVKKSLHILEGNASGMQVVVLNK